MEDIIILRCMRCHALYGCLANDSASMVIKCMLCQLPLEAVDIGTLDPNLIVTVRRHLALKGQTSDDALDMNTISDADLGARDTFPQKRKGY